MTRFAARAVAAVIALLLLVPAAPVGAGEPEPSCPNPPTLLSLQPALIYVAAKLAKHDRLTILAMGSSSTEGIGASSPAASARSAVRLAWAR